MELKQASGASVRPGDFRSHDLFTADPSGESFSRKFGLRLQDRGDAAVNTRAINRAAELVSQMPGGGTVVIPPGVYPVYTIRLCSHMTLRLCQGAVLQAARIDGSNNYDEPEANLWAGLQDHGHTHFANSLMYGTDLEEVRITGPGLIDGSGTHERRIPDGSFAYRGAKTGSIGVPQNPGWILQTHDPEGNGDRGKPGHAGTWFGNKGLALVRCRRVILTDFSVLLGGHFAVIAEGCDDMYVQGLMIDTNRDAFDIDSCQNVTVRDCVFNSVNDDALCLKASCGSGQVRPVRNVLIEDCRVMGYDCGSVYSGAYSCRTEQAPDGDGPTGRIKFGTEASGGCDTVTIRRSHFERSRGFCLESCDGAPIHDILMEDCTMRDVSSSPIFLRVGDRGRYPVTGLHADTDLRHEEELRLDHPEWALPNRAGLPKFPAGRYVPSYRRNRPAGSDEKTRFFIVNETEPCRINPAAVSEREGRLLLKRWDEETQAYLPDASREISKQELPLYANAVGAPDFARAWNIVIRRLTVRDADPRYPILIHGLNDSRIQAVLLEDIDAEFRGGLGLKDAVEQRLVNPFFCRSEARLRRVCRDSDGKALMPDPFNVPEMPQEYPEPSDWGVLPAFGLYVRHTQELTIRNVTVRTMAPDERPGAVFDDVEGLELDGLRLIVGRQKDGEEARLPGDSPASGEAQGRGSQQVICRADRSEETGTAVKTGEIVFVRAPYRRPTNLEYVPETPYHTTLVTVKHPVPEAQWVTLTSPAPGTPPDSLYPRTE